MLQNARVTVVPFLSYKGKTNRGPKLPSSPTPRLGLRETSKIKFVEQGFAKFDSELS